MAKNTIESTVTIATDSITIDSAEQLIPIESVQKILNRSRASVYRYANTDPAILNPPFAPKCLNAEIRNDKDDPLMFHPNEVARDGGHQQQEHRDEGDIGQRGDGRGGEKLPHRAEIAHRGKEP